MSISVEGDIKREYIPLVPYEELDKRYKELIKSYKKACYVRCNKNFYSFIHYLLLTMYVAPNNIKHLLDIISEAKPELVQKLMALQGTEVLEINLGVEGNQIILTLPTKLLNDIYMKLQDFIKYITEERTKQGLIQLNGSNYSMFIDEEFLKILKVWLHPEHQLRSRNVPKLLKNEPETFKIIQEKTAPIKKEITLVDEMSSKEKLERKIKEEKEEEDENLFEFQFTPSITEQKTDLNNKILGMNFKLTNVTKSQGDLKRIMIFSGWQPYEKHNETHTKKMSDQKLRMKSIEERRKEIRENRMKEKRFKTLNEYEESLKQQNKEDLKKIETEKK